MGVFTRLVAAAVLVATPAAADPMERLFSTPHVAALAEGEVLSYSHSRAHAGEAGAAYSAILLRREPAQGRVVITLKEDGRPDQTVPFRGMSGNPILMLFLEQLVNEISEATGGSPFYLRNRFKDAMRDRMSEVAGTTDLGGSDVPSHVITFQPFAGDANAGRLGHFSDLEIRVVLAEDAPGMFVSLTAATPGEPDPAFFEEIRLDAAH